MPPQIRLSAIVLVVASAACTTRSHAQGASVYDLTWDGPETSTVEECVDGDYSCIQIPINGRIALDLAGDSPQLINVNSDILLPPQLPGSRPVISPNLWHNLDLLVGEYLSSDDQGGVSMVFRPAEAGGVLRPYELFVDLTDGGEFLSLTGGIEQDAASPLEPDVRFQVSGRLMPDIQYTPGENVPEPTVLQMFVLALAGIVIASPRRR